MKKFLQFVAVAVIVLFAAQSAFAGLPCASGMAASCAPGCPMTQSSMGPNCPMARQMAANECPQGCCTHAVPQALAIVAAPDHARLTLRAQSIMPQMAVAASHQAFAVHPTSTVPINSPPRYILNQVFRI